MVRRWKLMAVAVLATGTLIGSAAGGSRIAAVVAADDATPTETATAQSTTTPGATDTPGFGNTPTPVSATPAGATPTATHFIVKPPVHNPTPVPPVRKHIVLSKPVVVEVGTKTAGKGLLQKSALLLANKYVPQLFVVAPTYVPKNYILQLIHVDPAQDQQTPADASLQYVPKGLTTVSGAYPSFIVNKQIGTTPIVMPGVKPQSVIIHKGVKGVGVVKGNLLDMKFKNGYETVHITWTRVTVSYDVTSNISISKLSIKDLLAVAASVQ